MKKVLSVLAISAMIMGTTSAVMADSFTVGVAGNYQKQVQDLNGSSFGANGAVSDISQNQIGGGASASDAMSVAGEAQIQSETTDVTGSNGFATHTYDVTAVTTGGSATAGGGIGAHVEYQNVNGGIATIGDGTGTGSISGSAMKVQQGVAAGGIGNAIGGSAALVDYTSKYQYDNVGTNSVITQTGTQKAVLGTGAGGVNGGGMAGLQATQIGGTGAANDGNGTNMAGAGAAVGTITTANTAGGSAGVAGSEGVQGQSHTYSQFSTNGAQTQYATGTVYTGNAVNDVTTTP